MIPKDKHKLICQQRRDREKAERALSILKAAEQVFALKGYLKATMDEIALAAEVTKPTIYLYFKTKDDLFFSLMMPYLDAIRDELEQVKKNLQAGHIRDGAALIIAIYKAFYHVYEILPETFRIIKLFQQQGLVGELKPEVQSALTDRGRRNFTLHRQLLKEGIALGMIKEIDVFAITDVIWGSFVGIIQLEEAKSGSVKNKHLKENTLRLAAELMAEALTIKRKGKLK